MFPSLIAPAPMAVDLGEFAQSSVMLIGGVPYLVGESARKIATPLWSRDKATDPDTLRLVLVAAAQLGAIGGIKLATGLPLAWYGSQRRAFREVLTGFGEVIALPGRPAQRLWIESVTVLPQGIAAAAGLIVSPDRVPGDYVVLDIGYRTADFVVVSKTVDGSIDFRADQAGTLEIGTHAIATTVARGLEHDYAAPFTTAEIETVRGIHIEGQFVDLTERRRMATAHVTQSLFRALTEVLDSRLKKVAGLITVGGGALSLGNTIPHAVVPDDPQWANAVGYLGALEG
jgi:plasmid segregation protein ParM